MGFAKSIGETAVNPGKLRGFLSKLRGLRLKLRGLRLKSGDSGSIILGTPRRLSKPIKSDNHFLLSW